jgi:hypothetical protein
MEQARRCCLATKNIDMSRLKQNQNIDRLILSINSIVENRCSLSEKDVKILIESQNLLKNLKKKKGKTNEDILSTVVNVLILLSSLFRNDSEVVN